MPRQGNAKAPRYYPAEDQKIRLRSARHKNNPTKLRSSITPGTVLIVLAGRFKGKRVVFLKQLESGLLLITGPYRLNGVPLRRVNQSYVIATSTKIDGVNGVDLAKFDDNYFKRPVQKKKGNKFFNKEDKPKNEVSQTRKDDQKAVDDQIIGSINAVNQLSGYLSKTFTLRKGQYPHQLVF
eukprot:TRINITY_DN9456_c0_g1_i1.p1 TRINITY_DN9456_c0_g1~~TRINITY_DN9456_c0_g1_i1.p1  ORF type:complete len:181 (-),score=42.30 TRINITY_DN9456_c0_g1_i1:96-638(-)